MQRYFIESAGNDENEFIVTGENARHISKVMRMTVGEEIIIVHENVANICEIVEIDQDIRVKKTGQTIPSPEMPIKVDIACGLPKGDKLELIAQKATELGMYAMIPFAAERSIVKWDAKKAKKNQERLQKIAQEAAEQSHRTHIPQVEEPISFKQLIQKFANYDAIFIADEEDAKLENRTSFKQKLQSLITDKELRILCIFGPEGGISRNESKVLIEAGAQTMSLGPRILRTETAPLYALSAISYEFE
ncbi:16S rRNA (uracil(1498)-N(3))-methyltransferase [Solibacillus sp. A46]|uniref:Ribosomal RNA small subunit methyltransferase E n=1 Tax=Solibacillus faecavium TaxID=2762221 RepID=A0ABR8XTT1_9BACL|nr:16S rRNA (uracil(1498)-N(3))-methyltransferase [Solibacillus faecavium]MBD8035336.1 16S rRNA (uracil(1498)-N(3))-methyltransferase [Solibacillus faecavium]